MMLVRRPIVLGSVSALLVVACNLVTGAADLRVCDDPSCLDPAAIDDERRKDASDEHPSSDAAAERCSGSERACEGRVLKTCTGDTWTREECPEACAGGSCVRWPSCQTDNASADTCGVAGTSCCESAPVPGGTFNRLNDEAYPATVSPFTLDLYEVTVGRFRAFVEAGKGTVTDPPLEGSGAHPKIPGSGWRSSWDRFLSRNTGDLRASLAEIAELGSWTEAPGPNENKPIIFVTWLQAFAFCAWDGGRLPTYAEWSFAAVGGDEQRVYPWSEPANSSKISSSHAAYECGLTPPSRECQGWTCSLDGKACDLSDCHDRGGTCLCEGCEPDKDLAPAGSLPDGVGRYGHFELAGNVAELVLDVIKEGAAPLTTPCVDCAPLAGADPPPIGEELEVLSAGEGWLSPAVFLRNTQPVDTSSFHTRSNGTGFRCARD